MREPLYVVVELAGAVLAVASVTALAMIGLALWRISRRF